MLTTNCVSVVIYSTVAPQGLTKKLHLCACVDLTINKQVYNVSQLHNKAQELNTTEARTTCKTHVTILF